MDERLPAGATIRCVFEFNLPAAATKAEILEWVAFELRFNGMMNSNPLAYIDLDAISEPVLELVR
jgi:hypothetical protein